MLGLFIGGIAISLFSILLFAVRKPFRLSDGIAVLLLLMLAVPVAVKMIAVGAVPLPMHRWMSLFLTCPFAYGPLLYFYARAEITEKPLFEMRWLLHGVPFAVFALLSLFFVFSELDVKKDSAAIKRSGDIVEEIPPLQGPPLPGMGKEPRLPHPPGMMPPAPGVLQGPPPRPLLPIHRIPLLGIFLLVSFITYTAAIMTMLVRHKKKMPDYFSYTSASTTLKWLQWITVCFFISYSFVYLSLQIAPSLLRHPLLDPRMTPDIALTFFIIVFGFFSLRQPVIYREPEERGGGEEQGEKKYEKSGLKPGDADRYVKDLQDFMEQEKPYLDPDLTIVDLSERLNIPRHHLTQVINERLDRNFYLFINEYRIREAREIMSDPKYSGHTILRIAYESGFNSKSVFNSIFKKLTNHTPTEYRLSCGLK